MHFEIFIKQCTFAASRAATAPSTQKGGFEWAIYRHYKLLYVQWLSSAARAMTLGQTATRIFEYLATENECCRVLPIPRAKIALCVGKYKTKEKDNEKNSNFHIGGNCNIGERAGDGGSE